MSTIVKVRRSIGGTSKGCTLDAASQGYPNAENESGCETESVGKRQQGRAETTTRIENRIQNETIAKFSEEIERMIDVKMRWWSLLSVVLVRFALAVVLGAGLCHMKKDDVPNRAKIGVVPGPKSDRPQFYPAIIRKPTVGRWQWSNESSLVATVGGVSE